MADEETKVDDPTGTPPVGPETPAEPSTESSETTETKEETASEAR